MWESLFIKRVRIGASWGPPRTVLTMLMKKSSSAGLTLACFLVDWQMTPTRTSRRRRMYFLHIDYKSNDSEIQHPINRNMMAQLSPFDRRGGAFLADWTLRAKWFFGIADELSKPYQCNIHILPPLLREGRLQLLLRVVGVFTLHPPQSVADAVHMRIHSDPLLPPLRHVHVDHRDLHPYSRIRHQTFFSMCKALLQNSLADINDVFGLSLVEVALVNQLHQFLLVNGGH